MKKMFSVLTLAIFMSSSFLSTNAFVRGAYDCFELADITANDIACEVEEITGSASTYAEWYSTWTAVYDQCMG